MNKRYVSILGSTGSIGTQALEVIAALPDAFQVVGLSAQNNAALLIEQAIAFRPQVVAIGNIAHELAVRQALSGYNIEVWAGAAGVCALAALPQADWVLTALVGYAGLEPTIAAIKAGKHIALANKETLVVAGNMIIKLAATYGVDILPVDSEHSAIFQCLVGERENGIEKIFLTASGGPFRGYNATQLEQVSLAQALKHPNWSMGAKITIDSASLMNKGLEVIEAAHLFGLSASQIEVVVHPQSIIHSMVCFQDGSIKAQLGLADMRLPIQYALSYPARLSNDFARFNFAAYPNLTFEPPDTQNFPCLNLAFQVMKAGGNMACALNAANEVAVSLFMENKIKFVDIPKIIDYCLSKTDFSEEQTLETYIHTDERAREFATQWPGLESNKTIFH